MSEASSEHGAVEAANARFYRAFETLDIQEMDRVWAHGDHVKCIHPGWPLLAGWPAVRASWETIFANTAEMSFTLSEVAVVTSAGLAWAVFNPVVHLAILTTVFSLVLQVRLGSAGAPFPVALVLRGLERLSGRAHEASDHDLQVPAWPVNSLFNLALTAEAAVLRVMNLPIGTSVMAVGRKTAISLVSTSG